MSVKLKPAMGRECGAEPHTPNADPPEPMNVGFSGNRIFTDRIKSRWVGCAVIQ